MVYVSYNSPSVCSKENTTRLIIVQVLRQHNRSDDLIADYCDGELFRSHDFFNNNECKSLHISMKLKFAILLGVIMEFTS